MLFLSPFPLVKSTELGLKREMQPQSAARGLSFGIHVFSRNRVVLGGMAQ